MQRLSRTTDSLFSSTKSSKILVFFCSNYVLCGELNQTEKILDNDSPENHVTSAVFGTTSDRSSISMRPLGAPPMEMSKKTTGRSVMLQYGMLKRSVCCELMYYFCYTRKCLDC
jgi:hypothetical protein